MEVGGEAGLALALLAINYYNREIDEGFKKLTKGGISTVESGSPKPLMKVRFLPALQIKKGAIYSSFFYLLW